LDAVLSYIQLVVRDVVKNERRHFRSICGVLDACDSDTRGMEEMNKEMDWSLGEIIEVSGIIIILMFC